MADAHSDERSIFLSAIDIASPGERDAFLNSACGNDTQLRAAVDALLHEHETSQGLLDSPETLDQTIQQTFSEKLEREVGPYKLLQQIGEGGMGVVYLAEQKDPVKRRVAVKIIRPGMDTRHVIARFEAERQALAMMDHVNIAKVFDAGATNNGRPYFVMELIQGVPFIEYCDSNRLTPRERLELFIPVCQAIQHAHQKGVIHRDIKPSNVLVTTYDDKPVPKVIDFGLAKAIDQKLTEKSLFTQFGTIAGTLEYMSPEQAEMNALGIDTRTDIYSLGVLLYQTLTGTTPLERSHLQNAGYGEIVRMIKEEEPPRPSLRLNSHELSPEKAAAYKMDSARLSAVIRGELDWITMRCLEKDRARRYETANDLARDIQRYLANEVVEARPPSAIYRFRKFVRRNRGAVIGAALIFLALLTGIAGTTFGLIRAEKQRGRAVESEELAQQRLVEVEKEKDKTEREKKIAQAVRDFLQNKLLGQADVAAQADSLLEAGGLAKTAKRNPTIRELLDRAAEQLSEEKIEASFPDEPLVQAALLHTVGMTYHGLGEFDRALDLLRRARKLREASLGSEHTDTLHTMNSLAQAYGNSGRHAMRQCDYSQRHNGYGNQFSARITPTPCNP